MYATVDHSASLAAEADPEGEEVAPAWIPVTDEVAPARPHSHGYSTGTAYATERSFFSSSAC